MDITKEESQRQEFREILYALAESQDILREKGDRARIYKRLENLYYAPEKEHGFRHFYSDIFTVLTSVKNQDKPGNIEILGQNLAIIRYGYQAVNSDENGKTIDISYAIRKLYDHVSLDIARMGYSDAADWKLSQEENIATIQVQVESAKNKVNDLERQIANQENDLKGVQKEYIAILGIFASVVLTFTGGIAFSTSVLQNLHTTSIYRVVGAILLIGIVLTNVLYGLFYYIDRLVNKPDHRKIKPLIISNTILLVLLAVISIGWWLGIAEDRNSRINTTVTEQAAADVPISAEEGTPKKETVLSSPSDTEVVLKNLS